VADSTDNLNNQDKVNEIPISNYAIICLISGILGLTILPGIGSVLALLMGSKARKEIDLNWGKLRGESIVKIGILLGWIGLGVVFLSLCAAGVVIMIAVLILLISLNSDALSLLIPLLI